MSSKENNPKMITKSFRLTASECSRLEEQMRADDYTNLSKYVRAKIFGNRIAMRKPKNLSTDEVRSMLGSVRERIAGFGADYNRIATHLLSRIDEPGQRNMAEVNHGFSQLNKLAKEIKGAMNSLIDLFQQIESRINKGYSPIKTNKNMMQVITIVGNIVDDAELRRSKDGNSQFISFKVAVSENKGDDRKTTYYDVTHPSTGVLHFLKKGKAVSVVGPLSIWQSHGQDGKSYLNASIAAKIIDLIGPKDN